MSFVSCISSCGRVCKNSSHFGPRHFQGLHFNLELVHNAYFLSYFLAIVSVKMTFGFKGIDFNMATWRHGVAIKG